MDNKATLFGKFFGIRGLSFLLVCSFFVFYIFSLKPATDVQAQKAFFYPDTCLGGWQLSKNASGIPEALDNSRYNDENSAVFKDGDSAIFCGEFKGELPPQTYQTRVSLRFSWHQDIKESTIIEEPTFIDSIINIFKDEESSSSAGNENISDTASSSEDVGLNEFSTTSESVAENEATSTDKEIENTPNTQTEIGNGDDVDESVDIQEDIQDSLVDENIDEVISEPEPEPEPEPTPAPESTESLSDETISLMDMFISKVYAEEVTTSTESYSSTSDDVIESVGYTIEETDVVADTAEDAIFAVEYTTNGADWNNIGYVTSINNDLRFELPKEILSNINDVEDIQIALRPVLNYDSIAPIYLDSMWLEVSYAPIRELGVHVLSSIVPEKMTFDQFFSSKSEAISSTTSFSMSVEQFVASSTMLYGLDNRRVLVGGDYYGSKELWLLDLDLEEITRIGFNEASIGDYPVAAKDEIVFWLNYDATIIFSYDLRTGGTLHEMALVGNLPETDDKVFTFPFTDWQVVWRANEFYFYKDMPGEVFRDENSIVVDNLNVYLEKQRQVLLEEKAVSDEVSTTTEFVAEDNLTSTTSDVIEGVDDINIQNENI